MQQISARSLNTSFHFERVLGQRPELVTEWRRSRRNRPLLPLMLMSLLLLLMMIKVI
jgi:hypothetical protein